jgi:hypothetical protein
MSAEFDHDLTPDQWEALKSLRLPAPNRNSLNQLVTGELTALGLATMTDGRPVLTPQGRHVLIRGSSRLWDVAA